MNRKMLFSTETLEIAEIVIEGILVAVVYD